MREDVIQESGSEVSIVIYDAPLPPRYFRFSKRFIRFLFSIVPIILGTMMIGLILWGLAPRVKDAPVPTLPEVMSDHDAKVLGLETEIKELKDSMSLLTDKLATQPTSTGGVEEAYLMAIKKPYGMQNFTAEKRVSLDQFELVQDQQKTTLKFQIISNNPETRVSGHVLVFMVSSEGLMAYPTEANSNLSFGIKYSMGEPFAVSRLRPTNAEFAKLPSGTLKFHIYIFSREGDLLLIKETETFKVGPKS